VASTNLNGTIPREIGFLQSLTSLSLDHNQLTGQIPGHLQFLTNLQFLHLDNNQLTGKLDYYASHSWAISKRPTYTMRPMLSYNVIF
jgi:Leucine-rich repeat (LRR) protein